jgi:hypothetical protein
MAVTSDKGTSHLFKLYLEDEEKTEEEENSNTTAVLGFMKEALLSYFSSE